MYLLTPDDLTPTDVREYLFLLNVRKAKRSTINRNLKAAILLASFLMLMDAADESFGIHKGGKSIS